MLTERIVEELQKDNCLSDRELATRIYGDKKKASQVNLACHKLVKEGRIRRSDDILKNYIPDEVCSFTAKDLLKNDPIFQMMHEEDIKTILDGWLINNDWDVIYAPENSIDADLVAIKKKKKWIIEVKGFSPLSSTRISYFYSVIGEILLRMSDKKAKYSIALPDIEQFRKLWGQFPALAKKRTSLSIIFVGADSTVEEVS